MFALTINFMTTEGNCKICGVYGPLTKEHVPPKKAFNQGRYTLDIISDEDPLGEPIRQSFRQGGVSFETLCSKCNNLTGGWYGGAYVDWAYYGYDILRKSRGKPKLTYIYEIYPLRVIKQILVMILAVNGVPLRESFPKLEKFIMDRYEVGLPYDFRIYCYFNHQGRPRYSGRAFIGQLGTNKYLDITEVAFPPFGFVLSMRDSGPPNPGMVDITFFSSFQYETRWAVDLKLQPLETWLNFPGDYRTKEEIQNAINIEKRSSKAD